MFTLANPRVNLNAITYRIPMVVTESKVIHDTYGRTVYAVCPRCASTLDRDFQSYCDRCGQKLDWAIFPDIATELMRSFRYSVTVP